MPLQFDLENAKVLRRRGENSIHHLTESVDCCALSKLQSHSMATFTFGSTALVYFKLNLTDKHSDVEATGSEWCFLLEDETQSSTSTCTSRIPHDHKYPRHRNGHDQHELLS